MNELQRLHAGAVRPPEDKFEHVKAQMVKPGIVEALSLSYGFATWTPLRTTTKSSTL